MFKISTPNFCACQCILNYLQRLEVLSALSFQNCDVPVLFPKFPILYGKNRFCRKNRPFLVVTASRNLDNAKNTANAMVKLAVQKWEFCYFALCQFFVRIPFDFCRLTVNAIDFKFSKQLGFSPCMKHNHS